MRFEWDPEKAVSNLRQHGVSFEQGSTVFEDPLEITIDDPDHSEEEERWLTMGCSRDGLLLVVCHTDRGDVCRIIGTRRATPRERRTYESGE